MNNIYDKGEYNIVNNKYLDVETYCNYLTVVNLYLSKKHKRKIKEGKSIRSTLLGKISSIHFLGNLTEEVVSEDGKVTHILSWSHRI
jgi:hypothetical protein